MGIKNVLKKFDVKLSDFANYLGVSRPTLNNYIIIFEAGNKIPNEKYQLIFDDLFSRNIETKEEFKIAMELYEGLINRDKTLGTTNLGVKSTDLLNSIIDRIKEDLMGGDFEESIYIFINMVLGNYKREVLFRYIANYFLYLNTKKDLDKISEPEKIFISNYYKLMHFSVNEQLSFDEEYYNKFIDRINEVNNSTIEDKNKMTKEIFVNNIQGIIELKIEEQLNLGIDIDNIDMDKIISSLGLK